jgi:hypothetical protein
MAITGDRYVATYEGHTIELVRNNWFKTLRLVIDGQVAARASCLLPRPITLTGTLEHGGATRPIVARSIPRFLLWTSDTIEVDGEALALAKSK